MSQIVDARGLACPQPVVNARKALEQHDSIIIIVDNMVAVENLKRMASAMKCIISEEKRTDGFYLTIIKTSDTASAAEPSSDTADKSCSDTPRRILVMSQDVMGKGDDILGKILLKSFFHTLAETDTIVFFNSGVKLVAEGSDVLEDIQSIEKKGTTILSCGTCLDYFKIKDTLGAGSISNMYEIKELLIGGSSVTTI